MAINRMTEKYCPQCESSKPFNNFHPHIVVGQKYMPWCKTCTGAKLREYIKKTRSEGAGLWCLLAECGIPFLRDVWNSTQKIISEGTGAGRKPDLFLTYVRTLKEFGIIVEGFWQSDVMLDEFIEVYGEGKEEQEELLDLKEQERIWGKFEPEDYEFLNFTFKEYTQDLLEMDANLIRRYRDLAKAELRKRKADESGDIQEIKNAQNILNNQLSLLKLNEFKSHNKTDEQLAFEKRVAMIEYTKPSECEDLKVYLDMVGYEKEKGLMMRSLRNAIAGTRDYPDIPKEELG